MVDCRSPTAQNLSHEDLRKLVRDRSQAVALALRDWIPSVIQAVEPYVSSEDIDKGARWNTDIARELEGSGFGILCVTPENIDAPWINFEAGALSKSLEQARVAPFLFAVQRSDVTGPLLQFQSTLFEYDDVLKLIRSINSACEPSLDEPRLDEVFEVWWPKLQERLEAVEVPRTGSRAPSRSTPDLLAEILDLTRTQQAMLADVRFGQTDRLRPAVEDLAEQWTQLRRFVRNPRYEAHPQVASAIEKLYPPLEFICDTVGVSLARPRRSRSDAPEPAATPVADFPVAGDDDIPF